MILKELFDEDLATPLNLKGIRFSVDPQFVGDTVIVLLQENKVFISENIKNQIIKENGIYFMDLRPYGVFNNKRHWQESMMLMPICSNKLEP